MYLKRGVQNLAQGSIGPLRGDQFGGLVTVPGGGKMQEAALAGRLFNAAMQTPATTSTTLNTTFVGMSLCNPTGSGKIIVVHGFCYAATAALTAATLLALATTTDSGLTVASILPRCTRYGYMPSIAVCRAGGTIVAPVIERIIATLGKAADTGMGSAVPPNWVNLEGGIILDPGRAVVTDTTVAAGAVMQFGFLWEEINQ